MFTFYVIKNKISNEYKTCDGTPNSGPRTYVKKGNAERICKQYGPDWEVVPFKEQHSN